MNLIYACVFHQQSYIRLLKLLVESIRINTETTHILVVTSPAFRPIIETELSGTPLRFYVLDGMKTMLDAASSRLHIFEYDRISEYEKILYLDTDILVLGDIQTIFNLEIAGDKLYAVEEGTIGDEWGSWGGAFFDFSKFHKETPAFSTGILYFMNSQAIHTLFQNTLAHVRSYKYTLPCLEQPFLVYNAFIEDKYDNQLMMAYAKNRPIALEPGIILYHFAGHPGNYTSKYDRMMHFMNPEYVPVPPAAVPPLATYVWSSKLR